MTRTSFTVCPFCGYEADRASAITEKPAPAVEPTLRPGDASMCIGCGEFSVMGFDEMLRAPTMAEAASLGADPRVQVLRAAWSEIKGKKRPG